MIKYFVIYADSNLYVRKNVTDFFLCEWRPEMRKDKSRR